MTAKNIFTNLTKAILGIIVEIAFVGVILVAALLISYFMVRIF